MRRVYKILSILFLAAAPAAMAQSQETESGQKMIAPAGMPDADDASFVNLTLSQCQELALRHSNTVLNAGLDVAAAKARKQEAVAEYFPKVSATAMDAGA